MTKMSYGEQLRHPNWQRLRLERLNHAGWTCQSCGDTETTLHVHHRRYIKGRMAWDYPAENFAVLCEQCHEIEHEFIDAAQRVLASIPIELSASAVALLSGYFAQDLDPGISAINAQNDLFAANAGFAARNLAASGMSALEIAQLAQALLNKPFIDLLTAELSRLDAQLQAEIARDIEGRTE